MPAEQRAPSRWRLYCNQSRADCWSLSLQIAFSVSLTLGIVSNLAAQPVSELPPQAATPELAQPPPPDVEYLPVNPEKLRPESDLPTWWHGMIHAPLGDPNQSLPMDLDAAVTQALAYSAQLQVLRSTAQISLTAIVKAQANFDPVVFADTRMTGTSDPVGNTLTTGGPTRFIDSTWYGSGGVRLRTVSGMQYELAQRVGYQNTNSQFFLPKNQATARLNLSITQPLLRGAGQAYNSAVVVLAQIDANIAHAAFTRDMQAFLLDFNKAYWDIYLQRAAYVQRRRLLEEARAVVAELQSRLEVDVAHSQLARAKAAAANRESALIRQETAIKNAVARFKALVNDPALDGRGDLELIPRDMRGASFGEADLASALSLALSNRPEVDQCSQEIRGAAQRLDLAKKDLLPMLNLVFGGYVAGLEGDSDFSAAYGEQFSQGRPTYFGGLVYELPFNNRAAQAQHQQRLLELHRASAQLQAVTANLRAEVEIAVREVSTTQREMLSSYQAMLAEQMNVDYLHQRWKLLAGDQQTAGVVLNDLLDAQVRRAGAEFDFVSAQVAHRLAWVNLKRSMGTLVEAVAVTGSGEVIPALPALAPAPPPGPPPAPGIVLPPAPGAPLPTATGPG